MRYTFMILEVAEHQSWEPQESTKVVQLWDLNSETCFRAWFFPTVCEKDRIKTAALCWGSPLGLFWSSHREDIHSERLEKEQRQTQPAAMAEATCSLRSLGTWV